MLSELQDRQIPAMGTGSTVCIVITAVIIAVTVFIIIISTDPCTDEYCDGGSDGEGVFIGGQRFGGGSRGHSSGGGFAIRFGSGPHSQMVQNYLLLAPAIPGSPTFRPAIKSHATAHKKRLLGLFTFNFFGIHAFDHLKVITFNKPLHLQDRTETLSYSHRLNLSYHPRFPLGRDLNSLPQGSLMLIGGDDEVINADDLIKFFEEHASLTRVESLPHINHILVANSNLVFSKILAWFRRLN